MKIITFWFALIFLNSPNLLFKVVVLFKSFLKFSSECFFKNLSMIKLFLLFLFFRIVILEIFLVNQLLKGLVLCIVTHDHTNTDPALPIKISLSYLFLLSEF